MEQQISPAEDGESQTPFTFTRKIPPPLPPISDHLQSSPIQTLNQPLRNGLWHQLLQKSGCPKLTSRITQLNLTFNYQSNLTFNISIIQLPSRLILLSYQIHSKQQKG